MRNFDFDKDTSENIFSHSYISYMANEILQGEEQLQSITLGADMFNKKNSGNRHQVLPYKKPPLTMELKVRVNIFGTKIRVFSEAKF